MSEAKQTGVAFDDHLTMYSAKLYGCGLDPREVVFNFNGRDVTREECQKLNDALQRLGYFSESDLDHVSGMLMFILHSWDDEYVKKFKAIRSAVELVGPELPDDTSVKHKSISAKLMLDRGYLLPDGTGWTSPDHRERGLALLRAGLSIGKAMKAASR